MGSGEDKPIFNCLRCLGYQLTSAGAPMPFTPDALKMPKEAYRSNSDPRTCCEISSFFYSV